ncbi:kinesin-like protein, putative [Trypanosoma equiperdum]|uniref:Kinesin-like protein, putative n=1 Tax=Trypanosoma equiperdum TaxID=5694 RepID=A0A1G4I5E8_TRYEQ|nr:kinesin-like protein, putative [Trypanosoma equiperdum]
MQADTFAYARVVVRVRPFTDEEAKVCPEDSPVPREIVVWDGNRTLTVLDATNEFLPRKNGKFEVQKVMWSFVDDYQPSAVVHKQKDVYDAIMKPAIGRILDGQNTAFCVMGGAGSGRVYSLYGNSVDGLEGGILPRFTDEILAAFKREKREDSTVKCQVEAIDVSNETYVDLLSPKRKPGANAQQEYKLVLDPVEGTKLQGVTRVDVQKPADMLNIVRQLSQVVPKRNSCHTVTLRIVESFQFTDPEQGQAVTMSRRVNVLFALLRNMPLGFQRCVDIAVERDSGENPLGKVPTRDTAFTKLFPDLLQHGYHLNFLCCVSPFYEHVRETMQTLTVATKLSKLKCSPKRSQDEALVQLRTLAAEVKNLKSEMVKQSESTKIVQNELNARELALMKQEAAHHECRNKLLASSERLSIARTAFKLNVIRTTVHRKKFQDSVSKLRRALADVEVEKDKADANMVAASRETGEIEKRILHTNRQIKTQEEVNAVCEEKVQKRVDGETKLKKILAFLNASPEERLRLIEMDVEAKEQGRAEEEQLEKEMAKITKELEEMEARCRAIEKEFESVHQKEGVTREKVDLKARLSSMEKDIAGKEEENRQLRIQAETKSSGCQCVTM